MINLQHCEEKNRIISSPLSGRMGMFLVGGSRLSQLCKPHIFFLNLPKYVHDMLTYKVAYVSNVQYFPIS